MSKNTNISELINYLAYDGSGNIVFNTVSSAASNTDKFLVSDAGTLKFRTAAQLLSDIGAQPALSGTGLVRLSGSTVSYDNATYATQTYVSTAISNLVASSPATLDTLNELALALGSDPNFATTVATSIGTKQPQLSGTGFVKISGTTISYDNSTYLTSASLTSYVPYTGATGAVNLGAYDLKVNGLTIGKGGGNLGQNVALGYNVLVDNASGNYNTGVGTSALSSLGTGSNNTVIGYSAGMSIYSGSNNTIVGIYAGASTLSSNVVIADGAGNIRFQWDGSNIKLNGNTVGSNAYTSTAYLPLAGGTLTGPLSGTSATFSGAISGTSGNFNGNVRAVDTYNLYKTGNATLGGQLSYDSIVNQLYLWNSISTGYFSIYTNSTERLNIGSDGTSTFKGPGVVIDRPTASSGEPYLAFTKNGVTRALIYGGDGTAGLRFFTDVNTFIVNASSTIALTSAGTNASIIKAGSGDELYLGGNDTWQMRLSGGNILMDNGGNVSIGTSTIGYKLFVSTTGTGAFNLNSVNSTVGAPMIDFYDTGRSQETVISSYDGGTVGTYIASYSNHPLMFGANAGASPTARMTIATDGRVGIGTTTPPEPLSVSFSAHGLISQHRQSNGIGVGQNFYMKFNNAAGSAVSYAGIYSDIQDNTTGAHTGRMILQVANAGNLLSAVTIASSGNVGISEVPNSLARLNVNGSTKINRSFYNWYQGYWTGNSTYWHMKTSMNAGLGGNVQYTMSLFKGYMYSYEGSVREGSIGFHNWDGVIYSPASSGNLFTTAYRSSDNFVVLVIPSGSGETGVTIDWHQAYGYPFVTAQVTAAGLHGATTGKY